MTCCHAGEPKHKHNDDHIVMGGRGVSSFLYPDLSHVSDTRICCILYLTDGKSDTPYRYTAMKFTDWETVKSDGQKTGGTAAVQRVQGEDITYH